MRPLVPAAVAADMRRVSLVMGVAALDTYMHRLIIERAYLHEKLPGGLSRLDIAFEILLAQADEAKLAARRPPHNSRPRVAVKRELRDRLLRETFQNYDGVSRALGMAGLAGQWKAIGNRMTPKKEPSEIRERLDAIVVRRNQIVHEGDYERKERPQRPRMTPISQAEASRAVDFLAQLIDAIHAVV